VGRETVQKHSEEGGVKKPGLELTRKAFSLALANPQRGKQLSVLKLSLGKGGDLLWKKKEVEQKKGLKGEYQRKPEHT